MPFDRFGYNFLVTSEPAPRQSTGTTGSGLGPRVDRSVSAPAQRGVWPREDLRAFIWCRRHLPSFVVEVAKAARRNLTHEPFGKQIRPKGSFKKAQRTNRGWTSQRHTRQPTAEYDDLPVVCNPWESCWKTAASFSITLSRAPSSLVGVRTSLSFAHAGSQVAIFWPQTNRLVSKTGLWLPWLAP